jgi:hypothetical protein
MYSEQTVSNLVVGGSSDFVTPKYEEFRKGRNEIGDRTTDVMQTFLNPMTVTTEAALRATVPDTSAFEAEPAEPVQGQPYGLEIPIYGESRLTRVSPVTPMARKGVA